MLTLSALAALLWAILILIYGSDGLFLVINQYHSPFADQFFRYYTHVGDGITFAIVALWLLWQKRTRTWFYLLATSTLGSVLVTQGLKRLVFDEALRPKAFFAERNIPIRLIEGLEVHSHNSFPSGHTISAFAMFTLLSLIVGNKRYQWLFFGMAWLAGFSRIYLAQHFPADVLAGTIAGVAISLFAVSLWQPERQVV